jgi:hypothetical protein
MAKSREYLKFTEKEVKRKHIAEEVFAERMTQKEWGDELWVTERQMRRIVKRYREEWDIGVMHLLRWRESNHHKDKEKEASIMSIINDAVYRWFWPKLLSEELVGQGIEVSKEWLRQIMIRHKLWESKDREEHKVRHRRERRKRYWEMVQYDGSYHHWLEDRLDEEFCLLVAIDDATGKVMHMKICDDEGYVNTVIFWMEYIRKYGGIPKSIYLDSFSTYKVNNPKAKYDKDMITNFDRSVKRVWCYLIVAKSPQAKWRVERLNRTLQDRLIKKMRLLKIASVEEGNKYIEEVFIEEYNSQFAYEAAEVWDEHIMFSEEQMRRLEWIFAIPKTRVIQGDYVVQYKNKFYQLLPESKVSNIYTKAECTVWRTIYWGIEIVVNEKAIPYKEVDNSRVLWRRAAYGMRLKKEKEERMRQKAKRREEERHRISKERQAKWRAEKLIQEEKKRMS